MAIAVLSGAAIAAQPAAAQINPYQQTSLRVGSDSDDGLAVASARVPGLAGFNGRGLAVVASFNSRYETNLARRPQADDGARFQPQLFASYGLGSERLGVFAEGSYGRDIVRGNQTFTGGDRSSFSGGLDFALTRCTGELGGSFRQSLNLRSEASQFGSFQQQTTTLGVAVSCRISKALSVNGGVNKNDDKNVQSVSQALNVERMTYSAGLGYDTLALGQLSLVGSIADVVFPGRSVVTPDGVFDDGFQLRNLRLGISRAVGTRIRVSLGASLISSTPDAASTLIIVDGVPQIVARDSFNGVGYDGSVDLSVTPRLVLQVSANRSVNANPFVGAFLTITNGYTASASARIGRYNLSAGGRFIRNRFQGGFASQFDPAPRRSDRFTTYFVNFGGRIGQRLRASLELNHSSRVANPVQGNFSSTGAGLNLSVAFGRGSR